MHSNLENKVIVVTGAGRGIGREIALLAAKAGAKVVVNDIGASLSGEGQDKTLAEAVVNLIQQEGGEAVASCDNVDHASSAQKIIEKAIDHFGRIDGVVNNAGILRDTIFHKMTAEDFEAVIRVHLLGSFYVSRAAASYFRQQASGSFVHFTSTSGLIGNVGQANYSAAKMGIVGLSKSIALDMARFNVRSNCIAPFAFSRIIASIPTESEEAKQRVAKLKNMTAAKIAPMAVYLLSDAAAVTGQIFAVRQNEIFLFAQTRPLRSVHRGEGWTPTTIANHAIPALQANFYPLDVSEDVFCWDPI